MFKKTLRVLLLAVASISMIAGVLQAKTPKDMFVIAKDISDTITLDPAEVFEFTGGEVIANVYDRLMTFEPEDLTKLVCGVCETYSVSSDGKTITYKIRSGLTFHSGNPITAEDVEFSIERVILLNKTPAFIFTQFGWNTDNVSDLITVSGDSVSMTITEDFSPVLVLNTMSAGIGSIVDKKTVMSHEADGDLGYEWLKSNSAGSGPFSLKAWKANESIVLERFPDYRHGSPAMKRVMMRHVPEPATQRLLVEKGDVDLARNLTPDQVNGIRGNSDLKIDEGRKSQVLYIAGSATHPILGKDKVMEAIRSAVDYDGMVGSFLNGSWVKHQAFWPAGMWAGLEETPHKMDLDKAKALLAEAGHGDGFKVSLHTLTATPFPDIAQSVQATLGKIGIEVEITTLEGSALWPKYRARALELVLARWSPDYLDPHSNADPFVNNPDNTPEAKLTGVLAWRNSWQNKDMNKLIEEARNESDLGKREQQYLHIQRKMQHIGPYAILFQNNEQTVMRTNVNGYLSGANFDMLYLRDVTKN